MKVYQVISNLINKNIIRPMQVPSTDIEDACVRTIFNHSFDCSNLSCTECYNTEMEEIYKLK